METTRVTTEMLPTVENLHFGSEALENSLPCLGMSGVLKSESRAEDNVKEQIIQQVINL